MARVGAWVALHRFLVGVEDEIDRGVADRVDADLEAGTVRPQHFGLQVRFGHHPESDVVGLAFVRTPHPGRPAADTAVAEEFGGTDAQPVVAEVRSGRRGR